jgi:osmotically-inducible protein OsmY
VSSNENNVEDLVCEALLMTNDISQAVIEIEHKEGIITLKGTVQSEKDKLTAEALARQQEGIVEVINKLHILDY